MKNRILVIDIGNTTVAFGAMRGRRVQTVWRVETAVAPRMFRRSVADILKKIKSKQRAFDDVIICSVVPKTLRIVAPAVRSILKVRPLVVGKDVKVPMKNRYRNPRQVGQDRLVCAYAAKILYGAPCIVVDFGTAITFDAVSRRGEYLGGIIVPGLRLSAESLFQKAALLPRAKIKKPRGLIGTDTENSILSGLFYGYGALCDGLIKLISGEMQGRPRVIFTGGHTRLMKQFIHHAHIIDKYLIFRGMELAASNVSSQRRR